VRAQSDQQSEGRCRTKPQRVPDDPAASQSTVGLSLAHFLGRNQDFHVSATGVVGYIAGATISTSL